MSAKKYLQMFQQPFFLEREGKVKPEVREEIEWARKTLKKEDWIVWYLRLYKLDIIQNETRSLQWNRDKKSLYQGVDLSKNVKFMEHMNKMKCNLDDFHMNHVKESMKHMVDMNLPEINAMVLDWKSPKRVMDQVDDYEMSWQAKNEGKSTLEYGEKLVEFEDGSAWFDLQVSGCEEEADLMGHCGNGSHRPDSPQTVLSYRRPVEGLEEGEEKRWTPYLTFILNKETGELGEMKGRGNSKPAERYHDAIMSLLKEDDRIKKVVGGGYRAENNFHLSDLEDDKFSQLMDDKPCLFSMFQLYQRYGLVDKIGDFDFAERIEETLSEGGKFEHKGKEYYTLHEKMDLEDLAREFGLDNLENYREAIEENHMHWYDGDTDWKSYHGMDIEQEFKKWVDEEPELAKRLTAYLNEKYEDEIAEEEWDMTLPSDIISLVEQEEGILDEVFGRAVSDGNEQGALNELSDAFDSQMKNFFESADLSCLRDEDEYYVFHIGFTKEQFFAIIDEHSEEFKTNCDEYEMSEMEAFNDILESNDINKASDLSVPHYGFSGFDEDYMRERIHELLSEKVKEECPVVDSDLLKGMKSDKLPSSVLKKMSATEMTM